MKQYENAKIDEAYSPPVELVDKAVLPDVKSWPPRKLFALGGLVIGALVGAMVAALSGMKLRKRLKKILREGEAMANSSRAIE